MADVEDCMGFHRRSCRNVTGDPIGFHAQSWHLSFSHFLGQTISFCVIRICRRKHVARTAL